MFVCMNGICVVVSDLRSWLPLYSVFQGSNSGPWAWQQWLHPLSHLVNLDMVFILTDNNKSLFPQSCGFM